MNIAIPCGRSAAALLVLCLSAGASAANPDISAIGQLLYQGTDEGGWLEEGNHGLDLGEAEIVLDAPLNPFVRGNFTFTAGAEGVEIEEATATLFQGLPAGLSLKAGKYRQGFGYLNAVHPHAYPFIEAPRLLRPDAAGYLPGEESFNDVAIEVSSLVPLGTAASTLSLGLLRGAPFHEANGEVFLDEAQTIPYDAQAGENRFGWLARLTASAPFGADHAALVGLSASGGTSHVEAGARTALVGADAKVRLALGPETRLVIQGEGIARFSEEIGKNPETLEIAADEATRLGFLAFTDLQFGRWNVGALYEQYETLADQGLDRAVAAFAGFRLMEETTTVRLRVEHFLPAVGEAGTAITGQLLFAMGPHKPHRF